jgi:hypothetical protein
MALKTSLHDTIKEGCHPVAMDVTEYGSGYVDIFVSGCTVH